MGYRDDRVKNFWGGGGERGEKVYNNPFPPPPNPPKVVCVTDPLFAL